jgi:glycosyltransferase involved in cell wall biosynthesis
MRILIAAAIYPPDPGGPAVHAQAQYVGFRKMGYETSLVALAHYRYLPPWIRHLFYAIALFFKSLRADVIYAHDAWGVGFIALVVSKIVRSKFVLRIGGDMAWEAAVSSGKTNLSMKEWYEGGGYAKNLFYKMTRFVIRRADAVIVVSPLLEEIYSKYYDVSHKKIHIVPNPLLGKKEFSLSVGKKIIFASRLVPYKNLEFVIRVMAKVFPEFPSASFIIMGDGPDKMKLQNLVNKLNLLGQVIFRGTVSQAEVIENTRDSLFALAPALTEFNPNYVLQAISYGKPFLISRENGLPFEVPEEFQFDPRNEEEFEKDLRELLSEKGYNEALEKVKRLSFERSWDEVLKDNERIIENLVSK